MRHVKGKRPAALPCCYESSALVGREATGYSDAFARLYALLGSVGFRGLEIRSAGLVLGCKVRELEGAPGWYVGGSTQAKQAGKAMAANSYKGQVALMLFSCKKICSERSVVLRQNRKVSLQLFSLVRCGVVPFINSSKVQVCCQYAQNQRCKNMQRLKKKPVVRDETRSESSENARGKRRWAL